MSIFDFFTRFILFVIPGFVTVSLFCYLTGQKLQTNAFSIAYVFAASALSFVLSNLFLLIINSLLKANIALVDLMQVLEGKENTISNANMIATLFTSVILGFVSVWVWNINLLFTIANKIRITHRTDNCAVWDYMFDLESWIVLRDYVTGNTYYGRVRRYSDSTLIREILLEDVHVWSKNDGDYRMEQVYISRNP